MELEREPEFIVQVIDEANDDTKLIHQNLVKYVESHVGPSTYKELTLTIRDANGELIAGLHGMSNWQWLFVKSVFVSEGYRYKGLGTKLLKAAEQEARRRSCAGVWLDTFSFQSPDFYKKLGYTEFGVIDNYPYNHRRSFFSKKI